LKLPSLRHALAAACLTGVVACLPPLTTGEPQGGTLAGSHLLGWLDPLAAGFHGAVVRAAGYDYTLARAGGMTCNACHAGESAFQPSPNARAPNCFACHDGGPDGSAFHPRGWLEVGHRYFHGEVVAAFGHDVTRARLAGLLGCSACHSAVSPTLPSSNSRAPSCFACHAGGPDGSANHPPGWLDPASRNFHGKAANTAGFEHATWGGTLACSACHGGYTPGDESPNSKAPSCYACHAGGPDGSPRHPAAWNDPAAGDFHGKVVVAAGTDFSRARAGGLTCNACHAGLAATQPSPVKTAPNCFACHAGGPSGSPDHPEGWNDLASANFHGRTVVAAGRDFRKARSGGLTCDRCHAGGDARETSPQPAAPNCYSCHAGGPGGSPGHPAGFMTMASASFHGKVVREAGFDYTKAKSGGLACSACHAGAAPGAASPVAAAPNCHACHTGGPTGKGHGPGWGDPRAAEFHGRFLGAHGGYLLARSGKMHCGGCHATAADVPSPWPLAPTCFACHQGGPSGAPGHPAGWAFPGSGSVAPHAQAARNDLAYCGRCHNTAAIGRPNPAPGVRLDCWSCHTGPGG